MNRRVSGVRAHASTAAPARQDSATSTSKLADGPQFQYFVNQQYQQPSAHPVVKTIGSAPPRKVYIETYGCQMNVNDSEVLLSVLADNGFAQTTQDTDADVIFLNTCAIREQAEQRIWSRLSVLKQLKIKNKSRYMYMLCSLHNPLQQVFQQQRLSARHGMCKPLFHGNCVTV